MTHTIVFCLSKPFTVTHTMVCQNPSLPQVRQLPARHTAVQVQRWPAGLPRTSRMVHIMASSTFFFCCIRIFFRKCAQTLPYGTSISPTSEPAFIARQSHVVTEAMPARDPLQKKTRHASIYNTALLMSTCISNRTHNNLTQKGTDRIYCLGRGIDEPVG